MAAKVVFSDGSKAMAHNLDDQYERWMLKYEGDTSGDGLIGLDEFLPELPVFTSVNDALSYKELLSDKRAYLHEALAVLNSEKRDLTGEEYQRRKLPLVRGLIRSRRQLEKLKALTVQLRAEEQKPAKPLKPINVIEATLTTLKERRGDGDGSFKDQQAFSVARFEQIQHEWQVGDDKLAKLQTERAAEIDNSIIVSQDKYIENLKTDVRKLQARLIAAYERIIELQGGSDEQEA